MFDISKIHDEIDLNTAMVFKKLHKHGFQSYLVGGGVRDLLLRRTPKDLDVATNASPEEIKKIFKNCRLIGRRFLLAHIIFDKQIVEVATFRANPRLNDKDQKKSTHGIILRDNVFGTIKEDSYRRDLTINSIYYDMIRNKIVDYTNGLEDLENKVIRIIGNPEQRYIEDPVRILRVIRFAAKLNFSIEKNTEEYIKSQKNLLTHISPSRLFDEIIKMFHSGHGYENLKMMIEYGLMPILFPATEQFIKNESFIKLLTESMIDTDDRINNNKPVVPIFIFVFLIWTPLQNSINNIKKNKKSIDNIMNDLLSAQREQIAIPKRLFKPIKDIWILQNRLIKSKGKNIYKVLRHPKFAASFDFLLLRTKAGEIDNSHIQWWSEFRKADEFQQKKLIIERNKKN